AAAERNNPIWSGTPELMARQPGFHWLLYKSKSNDVVFGLNNTASAYMMDATGAIPADPMPVSVRIPASQLAADAWHEIVVSWDAPRGKYWLRVDGVLQAGEMPET